MRFLHTADWHLGRLFHGIHLTEDQSYVLTQFIDLVKDCQPDAVIIAGDIYDRAVPPVEAVKLLDDTLAQLVLACRVPVIMIAGNHDSPERIGFGGRLVEKQGLYVASKPRDVLQPVILYDEHGPVYFLPLPYADPAVVRAEWPTANVETHEDALAAMLRASLQGVPVGARTVGVAHAFVAGGQESESERPLSIGGSSVISNQLFRSLHYTALGHLHRPQRAGGPSIGYAGSLLKYSFAEASQSKSVSLIEMDGLGQTMVTPYSLRARHDVRCLRGCFAELVQQAAQDCCPPDDYLSICLEDAQPILDARSRLQEYYPNLMEISYSRLAVSGDYTGPAEDHRQVSERELFASFFNQMTGTNLAEDEMLYFSEVVDELNRRMREVKL